jgi:osmotically-inducible protein OsmY
MEHDESVLKQVQAAVKRGTHRHSKGRAIVIGFNRGTLSLEGVVPNVRAKKLALNAASSIMGVTGIIDRLRVDAGPVPGDGATRDSVCTWLSRDIDFQNCGLVARIKGQRRVLRDPGVDPSGQIEVAVADGVITLSGQVISLSHKRLAGVIAWWARGCRDVVNDLEVVPPEADNDDEITDALRLVLESDPYVHADQLGIRSRNGVVLLEGMASSEDEKARAESDAWCLFAVDGVINRIQVRRHILAT